MVSLRGVLFIVLVVSVLLVLSVLSFALTLFIAARLVPGVKLERFSDAIRASLHIILWTIILAIPAALLVAACATNGSTLTVVSGLGLFYFIELYAIYRAELSVYDFEVNGMLPRIALSVMIAVVGSVLSSLPVVGGLF